MRRLVLFVVSPLFWVGELHAQCPDGSPPPCGRRAPTDTNAFVVVPFTVRGPTEVQYLRESMVDLLHMSLNGVGRVSVRHPPTLLRRLRGVTDPTDVTLAAPVARAMGAGRVIGGSVVAAGARLRVRADVYDAVQERAQFSVEGEGAIADLGATVDRLATAILARKVILPEGAQRVDLAEYATRSPGALQAYLVAMQHLRRAERATAGDSLRSALRQDPNFGLAHYALISTEGSQVGSSGVRGGMAAILRDANARRDSFPERIQILIDIQTANHQGERVRTLTLADAAARRFPNDADVAFHQADKYFHHGLNVGVPRDRVMGLFARALELDDGQPELLEHHATLLAETGDTTATIAALQRCRGVVPRLCDDGFLRILHGTARPWATRPADSLAMPFLFLLRSAPNLARALAVTDSFYLVNSGAERPANARYAAWMTRAVVELARGRHGHARSLVDSAQGLATGAGAHDGMALLVAIAAGGSAAGTRLALERLGQDNVAFMALRAWYTTLTQPDSVEPMLVRLAQFPPPDSARGRAIATGLRGIMALRRGDTATARVLLRTASTNSMRSIMNRTLWPGPWFSLVAARLEAARGNWAEARVWLSDIYPAPDAAPWLTEGEEVRAQVALALGDTTSAVTALRNVVEVWANADSTLQPRVTAARATLARLRAH